MSKTYELSYTAERIDEILKEVDEHTIYSDATTEEHGLMSATDKTKLDALPTAQQIDGALNAKVDKEAGKGLSKNDYTDAEKESVASAYHKPQNGIPKTDFDSSVQKSIDKADTALQSFTETDPTVPSWAKAKTKPTYTASEVGAIPSTDKGANGGVATLNSGGKVPQSQLPSYVDDVLEYSNQSSFPATGESGKIYVALDTNKTYRWSGSDYVEISQSLALGENSSTAFAGDRGKAIEDKIPTNASSSNKLSTMEDVKNVNLFVEQSSLTDQQRNIALANVSNQTTNSTTGKMGYKVLDSTKVFAEQVTTENTIYEIRDVFDLRTIIGKSTTVNCNISSKIENITRYCSADTITINSNEAILLDNNSFLIDFEKSSAIFPENTIDGMPLSNSGFCLYKTPGEYYIGKNSSGKATYKSVNNYITLPVGSTLYFNGGMIEGGLIIGNNTFVKSGSQCFKDDVVFWGTWRNEEIFTKWFSFVSTNDGTTLNNVQMKQLQGMAQGTKGCKIIFENGYYQFECGHEATEYATHVEDQKEYPVYKTNVYDNEIDSPLFLYHLPYVEIFLNGSTLKVVNVNFPSGFIRLFGITQSYIHDGNLEGCAKNWDYPSYIHWSYNNQTINNKPNPKYHQLSRSYEFAFLLYIGGGSTSIINCNISYATGDGIMPGSTGWYNRITKVVVPNDGKNINIDNCLITKCGRNGIGCHSNKSFTIKNTEISFIGSTAGNGEIDENTHIMGWSPMAGIDFEFEDGRAIKPIVSIANCNFHDNIGSDSNGEDLGFAQGLSNMVSFSCKNTYIGSGVLMNNLKTDGSAVIEGCEIHIKGTNTNLYSNICKYNNCDIIIEKQMWLNIKGEYHDCNITAIENIGDILSAGKEYASFYNCKFEWNSNPAYLCNKLFDGCDITINVISSIAVVDTVFKNCNFMHIDSVDDVTRSFKFSAGAYTTPGSLTIEDCVFNNKCRGTGNSVDGYFINYLTAKIKNTIFKEELNCYYGSVGMLSLEMDSCVVKSKFVLSPYNISGSNTIDINNCDIENLCFGSGSPSAVDYSSPQIHINNSKISVGNTLYYRPKGIIFNNVDFIKNDNYTDTYLTFINSRLNFSVAVQDTSGYTLYNSLVSGAITEAAFNGIAKDTIFMTPIPTHGDSATRPAASSMPNTYAGFTYFDETLGLPLYLKVDVDTTDPGNPVYTKSWVKADGTLLS